MRRMFGFFGATLLVTALLASSSALADRSTSPNYILDGNAGGSFGGTTGSSNYSMTSIGGEAVVGGGSSSSYILDQQWDAQSITPTMQLSVQPSGLVAYYPLDENTGTTTADASRYQNNGTLGGGAAWYSGAKIGAGVDMQGSGSVSVPDNSNLPSGSAMTVEAWVRQPGWFSNNAFVTHWDYVAGTGGSGSWALQTGTNNNLRVFISAGPGDAGDNYVDTDAGTWSTFNAWRHVVVVYDGSQAQANKVKVYIDGTLAGSTAYGTLPSTLTNSTGALSIGSFPGLGRSLTGAIDHLKLFNRALAPNEVSAEYAAQAAGTPAGMTLGTIASGSTTSLVDVAVRTNSTSYNLAASQDHNLQSGTDTIPAVGGTIGAPSAWTEGATRGLGFTIVSAPTLDGKWGSGANYAAFPGGNTAFYSEAGHSGSAVDVVGLRLRLDVAASQPVGAYSNTITYTGTTLP